MFEPLKTAVEKVSRLVSTASSSLSSIDDPVLDSDRGVQRIGYAIVIFVFAGFGVWASFAPLESAAFGIGFVQVEGDTKPVQHLEGGIVSKILVKSGDRVTRGQPVLLLESTQLVSEKKIIEGRYWALQAQVNRLESERSADVEVRFSNWLTSIRDARAENAVASEKAMFLARSADRSGEILVLEQRIKQFENQISGIKAVVDSKRRVADSLKVESLELGELLEEGYVDKQRIRQLDRSYVATLGEIADLESRQFSAEAAIAEHELSIAQIRKRFITAVVNELKSSLEQLFDYEQRLEAIVDRVDRTTVRAPANGTVMALQPNSIGEVLVAGQDLMSIVPDEGRLVIDVQLSPMDIDRLHIGQEVEVRFAVFKDSYTITGSLMRLSADSLIDEATGQPYFEAKVELLEDDLKLLGPYQLVPGMPADVLVKTGSRTLLGYLTSPLQRMFEKSLIEE